MTLNGERSYGGGKTEKVRRVIEEIFELTTQMTVRFQYWGLPRGGEEVGRGGLGIMMCCEQFRGEVHSAVV